MFGVGQSGPGGSGWGGGDGGGGVERIDRGLADEEAEDLAEPVPAHVDPVPAGAADAVLLLGECLLAAGSLLHQLVHAAAEISHDLEQRVPEDAVAEAWDDGEIEADIEEDAADGLAADLALEILRRGHEEFGVTPAGGAGCAGGGACGWG